MNSDPKQCTVSKLGRVHSALALCALHAHSAHCNHTARTAVHTARVGLRAATLGRAHNAQVVGARCSLGAW